MPRSAAGPFAAVLALLVARAAAQSSCAAGEAVLDGDGHCDQCWSSVPSTHTGRLQVDVSDSLANNAAGCVYTKCFLCPGVVSYVITVGSGAVATNAAPGCSGACGCVAYCPGMTLAMPIITPPPSCELPPAVADMTITLSGGNAVGQPAAYTCTATGSAPADGTATRTCQASYSWSGTEPTQCQDRYVYQGGTLYLMPAASNPDGDSQAGTNWYLDLCAAAGLSGVGCVTGFGDYTTSDYTQGGRSNAVRGWGAMGCNIDSWLTSNTGWSNFVHLQSLNSNLYGDVTGYSTNNYGAGSPVHAVCATPP